MTRLFHILFAFAAVTVVMTGPVAVAQTEPADAKKIDRWIEQLDADEYVVREAATHKLAAAGAPAIARLTPAMTDGSLEVVMRGVLILQEGALSQDVATERAAHTALTQLAGLRVTAVARRADATLKSLGQMRRQRAEIELARLGAGVGRRHMQIGLEIVQNLHSIHIGENWRGGREGLRHLQWMTGLQQITFEGADVTDAYLEPIENLEDLTSVTISNTQVTDRGLAQLGELPRLRQLRLWYSPIGDGAIDELVRHKHSLAELRLIGTQITPEGAERLKKAFADQVVDYRPGGAFLGIGCDDLPDGCFVSTVQPGTAASNADLRNRDRFVTFGGEKVEDFAKLTALIGKYKPDDRVMVEVMRGEQLLTKEVKLGSWKPEP